MTSAALHTRRRAVAIDDVARPKPAPAEVERLFADAEPAPPQANPADRRGPFRPQTLISTRSRLHGETIARSFQAIDAGVIMILTWVVFDFANPTGVLASPIVAVAPAFAPALMLIVGLAAFRTYSFRAREAMGRQLLKLCGAFAVSGAIVGVLIWSANAPQGLALWAAIAFITTYLLHLAWRVSVSRMRASGRLTPTIVIVGANKTAERLIATALERRDIAVLGVFDDRRGRAPGNIGGVPVLGGIDDLLSHRIMPYVDRVVISVTSTAQDRIRAMVDRLRVLPNEVTLLIDVEGEPGHAAVMSRLADMPLAQVSGFRPDQNRALVKRIQDLVIGMLALIIAAPVMAIVALAVKLESPGPIFFRQRRHGFNNEDIVVWKFRSMSHARRDDKAERQISADDDRVTRVGHFIRRTSLDELPQILNVLAGEMSLVGPRPHAPTTKTGSVESSALVAEYAHRHRMKPGMTGWAAIKGSRGAMDTPEKVRRRVALDIEYIERQSFWLDLYIMLMTLPCLLGDRHTAR